jgi:hypothetical protein
MMNRTIPEQETGRIPTSQYQKPPDTPDCSPPRSEDCSDMTFLVESRGLEPLTSTLQR